MSKTTIDLTRKTAPSPTTDTWTPWLAVRSSNLQQLRYSRTDTMLEVQFHGGRIYRYLHVPEIVFRNLLFHPHSKGKYFHTAIRNSYATERIA